MAYVHAVLFAERLKTFLHWVTITVYAWLFAEVIWYYSTVGQDPAPPMDLHIGGPILLIVTSVRVIGRLRRGF